MNKNITFGAITAIVIGVAVATGILLTNSSDDDADTNTSSDNIEQMNTASNSDTNFNETSDNTDGEAGTQDIATAGVFADYNESLVANAANGDVVLFFHADWCPTCLALERDIERNASTIPADVTILKAPYGNNGETELAQEYGVRTQHTLIQVNENGEVIKEWVGSFRLEDVLEEIV